MDEGGKEAAAYPVRSGALQQPGAALGPLQWFLHYQHVGEEPRQQQADPLAVRAQHRVAKLQVPEQLQELRWVGLDPERGTHLDPQQAVARERLNRLVAAEGGAAQDALDRIVLQADDEPLGLKVPVRGQWPQPVRARPGPLVAGVGVADHQKHVPLLQAPGTGTGVAVATADCTGHRD